MKEILIGIIGGSGLYQMPALQEIEEIHLQTPFGTPADAIVTGKLHGVPVAFLPRFGRSHTYSPTAVPYRANMYALKSLGVRYIISASAVGSLQEEVKPLDMLIPDQLIDRTKYRLDTFFRDNGLVTHVNFAQPFCPILSEILTQSALDLQLPQISIHGTGTYLCMEGPAFSTKAESSLYRSWGAHVIGMTNSTEAKLAREAQIAYATLALVTDYDCWRTAEATVTVEMVVANLRQNVTNAQAILAEAITRIGASSPASPAHNALKQAILTDRSALSDECKARLRSELGIILPADF